MQLTNKVIDTLYAEAMLLADESRAYFDRDGNVFGGLSPIHRVRLSCESLKITTRLMHIIAWLLSHRSESMGTGRSPLGDVSQSDTTVREELPEEANMLVASSEDLYARVARIDRQLNVSGQSPNAPRGLISRIERSF